MTDTEMLKFIAQRVIGIEIRPCQDPGWLLAVLSLSTVDGGEHKVYASGIGRFDALCAALRVAARNAEEEKEALEEPQDHSFWGDAARVAENAHRTAAIGSSWQRCSRSEYKAMAMAVGGLISKWIVAEILKSENNDVKNAGARDQETGVHQNGVTSQIES